MNSIRNETVVRTVILQSDISSFYQNIRSFLILELKWTNPCSLLIAPYLALSPRWLGVLDDFCKVSAGVTKSFIRISNTPSPQEENPETVFLYEPVSDGHKVATSVLCEGGKQLSFHQELMTWQFRKIKPQNGLLSSAQQDSIVTTNFWVAE